MIASRLLLVGALCASAVAAAVTGCGGRRGPATQGASLQVRGGPAFKIKRLARPTGYLTSQGAATVARTNEGFIGANVSFTLESPAYVRFFVVSPRARVFQLRSRPNNPGAGFAAGEHTVEVAGDAGAAVVRFTCPEPCYLIGLASPSEELFALSPWGISPEAPGFRNPDSLLVWVAREAVQLRDSTPWSGTYRRLTLDEARR